MTWQEIQQQFEHQWLLVEAVEAHTENGERILDDLAVIKPFPDSKRALRAYAQMRRQQPGREFYVFHTDNQAPSVDDMFELWLQ